MGHMGNPAASTPFLDRFASEEAVSFGQAFCQNPVCVPSRCSFFTGLYPHVHGHRTMSHLLHPGERDLFAELKDAGYCVWMNARNDLYAGQIEGWVSSHADEIFYGGDRAPAPGPKGAGTLARPENGGRYSHYEGELSLDADGKNITGDDEDVQAAAAFLRTHKDDERPLCVFLGLMYPHVPYQVEEPYFSRIDRSRLPERIRPEQCAGKSRMLERIRQYQDMDDWTEEEWNELRAVYLGMCAKIDDQFRYLCDQLKEAGIYDDCLILFFSDHGDFAGDYGLSEKAQSSFEDCLTRVPLLVKPPKGEQVDPGITDSLAELVDFYATVVDYAGIEPGRTHFGRSLRPVLENRSQKIRRFVCCEGGRLPGELHCDEYHSSGPNGPRKDFVYWPKMMAQTDDDAHAKGTMIRTDHWKYISRITGEDEFYDLEKDPGERVNQMENPLFAPQIRELQVELMRWLQATSDVVPYAYDQRFTPEMLWAKVKNQCPPGYEADVKEKIRQGMKQGLLYLYVKELREKAGARGDG